MSKHHVVRSNKLSISEDPGQHLTPAPSILTGIPKSLSNNNLNINLQHINDGHITPRSASAQGLSLVNNPSLANSQSLGNLSSIYHLSNNQQQIYNINNSSILHHPQPQHIVNSALVASSSNPNVQLNRPIEANPAAAGHNSHRVTFAAGTKPQASHVITNTTPANTIDQSKQASLNIESIQIAPLKSEDHNAPSAAARMIANSQPAIIHDDIEGEH
jgi:hypothetical protein